MKHLLTILFLIGTLTSFAKPEEAMPVYWLKSSVIDTSLTGDKAIYVFEFQNIHELNYRVMYSIDGVTETREILVNSLKIETTAGKHAFQFYYNESFQEVYTDSIDIQPRHKDTYAVPFPAATYPIMQLEKPVIYLYPEVTTKVQVVMNIKGNRAFMFPEYTDCWEFTAHPNGDLTFGKNTYNYLFWEATIRDQIIPDEGFVVAGDNSINFLEEKLSEIGFTSKEQADFITYWAPRMIKNEHNFVQFVFNEECDEYATMKITPQPDHIYRIYMKWTSVYEGFKVDEQIIPKVDRSGFTVIEWGGQESRFRRINCMAHEKIEL
ncbi:MAG: hypothetical protein ACI837_001174 [Crocinitomicaceae bacterium]|jgi:hypothetical protein